MPVLAAPAHKNAFRRGWTLLACLVAASPALSRQAPAQQPKPSTLADMSIEDLLNIEVTSVSKRPEKLSDAPAAVFVITREDIRRSGASSVPEALRLAPNLEVAKVDAFTWAISARGFNSNNGNKLLVLIDGRTVYSPIFSGVWWDAQDVVLEDIDRIEIISGSGGTLWGSNAVDGVINITTRNAKETKGGLVKATAGKGPEGAVARYGLALPGDGALRVYAKATSDEDSALQNGSPALDGWHTAQGGFRGDWGQQGRAGDTLTVQGDAYKNSLARTPLGPGIAEGGNLLGRWEHVWSQDTTFQAQIYADRVLRDIPGVFEVRTDTLDVDVQGQFRLGARNAFVWGGGYRSMDNTAENGATIEVLPDHLTQGLSNLFAQDTVTLIPNRLDLILGIKLEHNDFTGTESLPDIRLAWTFSEGQTLWAAASRAVRTPAVLDKDEYLPIAGTPYYLLGGGPDFTSEIVKTYEAGYKLQTSSGFSLSFSPFYNSYDRLRGVEPDPNPADHAFFAYANDTEGHGWGAELWGDIPVTAWWRLKPAYSFLRQDLQFIPGTTHPLGLYQQGNDPRHRILLTSLMSPTSWLELDFTLRHMSALPDPVVPAYTTMDAHIGWKPGHGLEVAIIGQNLFQPQHWEFNPPQSGAALARAALLRISWAF